MKALISGLINIETTLKIKEFPIKYFPIDYPFFGIQSSVSGVAYNISKALTALDNEVRISSFVGNDDESKRILSALSSDKIDDRLIYSELRETPVSIALYDDNGKRQIYCDLKDIQEHEMDFSRIKETVLESDLVVLCNINFNRANLKHVKKMGKTIACDVHVLSDINDEFNRDFMEYADILFLSDERLPCGADRFIRQLKETYPSKIIVIGMGEKGAMLYERDKDTVHKLNALSIGNIVNTIGAGDALFSGFLNYYVKGVPALEALSRAEVFAALKIQHNGAAKGFCSEDDVEKIYRQNTISISEI